MIPAIRTGRRAEAFRQFQYPTVPLHVLALLRHDAADAIDKGLGT